MIEYTVIMPVHNAEKTILKSLKSISSQLKENCELIIVDDDSTDLTEKIIKDFFNSLNYDFKFTLLENKKKSGPAVTRNKGIKSSKGKYITFIDSDCVASKNWFSSIKRNFEGDITSAIMGNTKIPKSTLIGDSISALGFPGGANAGFENMWHVSKEGFTDHITSCNFAAKKEVFEKYGLFDESFPLAGGEDPELSYRLSKNGVKIKYCPDVLVYHEPRKELLSFIKWMIYRGRSNYYFKKKVGKVGNFVKLRLWSSKNIIKKFLFDQKIILIIPLLFLSFILQQIGYMWERYSYRWNRKAFII